MPKIKSVLIFAAVFMAMLFLLPLTAHTADLWEIISDPFWALLSSTSGMIATVTVIATVVGFFFPPAGVLILRMLPMFRELAKQIPLIVEAVRADKTVSRGIEVPTARDMVRAEAKATADNIANPLARGVAKAALNVPSVRMALTGKTKKEHKKISAMQF